MSGVLEVCGFSGTDQIFGSAGADVIDGGVGKDSLYDGQGDDTFIIRNGDASTDIMLGGLGTDTIRVATDSGIVALTNLAANDIANFDASGKIIQGTSWANVFDLSGVQSLNHVVELRGLGGNSRIVGTAGVDVMDGGTGNDTLLGGNGSDTLIGGTGVDELTGGFGANSFVLNTASSAATNVDRLVDFATGSDRLFFDDAVFTALSAGVGVALEASQFYLGTTAAAADDQLNYSQLTGALFYDADCLGSAAQILVANLTNMPALAATEIFLI